LTGAVWPRERLGEALHALAMRAGLPLRGGSDVPPVRLREDEIASWLEASALHIGVEAHRVSERLSDVGDVLPFGGPTLVRMAALDNGSFLAVLGGSRQRLRVIGPDGRIHLIPTAAVSATLCRDTQPSLESEIEQSLDRMKLEGKRRARAREALVRGRLATRRFRDAWTLRLPANAAIPRQLVQFGVARRSAALFAAYAAQSLLFLASWWLLGRGILQGTFDRGWILGWLLLLVSIVPLRMLVTWTQGTVALAGGFAIRRRLLRGALNIDRRELEQKGHGDLFGTVLEATSIEALATSGGVLALLSVLDLGLASLVLWAGGITGPLLLATWVVVLRS
jgi:ATP-binding cassette subfamily B protein